MGTIQVHKYTHKPIDAEAVMWSGDAAEGRLLLQDGWVIGMDNGFGENNAGSNILRGIVDTEHGTQLVFPGQLIVRAEGTKPYPCAVELHDQFFDYVGPVMTLTDGIDSPPAPSPIPTGENPDAVNLEPPQVFSDKAATLEGSSPPPSWKDAFFGKSDAAELDTAGADAETPTP